MFTKEMKNVLFTYFWFVSLHAHGYTGKTTVDIANTRANTLSDDADDIQRQLDNEARDRIKFGRPQTIWILHYPSRYREYREMTTQPIKLEKDEVLHSITTDKYATSYQKRITLKGFNFNYAAKPDATWKYREQSHWFMKYPECGGRSQSPVRLPCLGMQHTKAKRKMLFSKYHVKPKAMTMVKKGETVSIVAEWASSPPFIYGGAAHSRRYVFHSLSFRRPSEHSVGGLYYPLESQALHISAEYSSMQEAINAAMKDRSAMLVVANIYVLSYSLVFHYLYEHSVGGLYYPLERVLHISAEYSSIQNTINVAMKDRNAMLIVHSNHSHEGLEEIVRHIAQAGSDNITLSSVPLKLFSPPLKEYAAYHGSLTTPPCTEAVLWLIRARALPITRELVDILEAKGDTGQRYGRMGQPLNDRQIYYFD